MLFTPVNHACVRRLLLCALLSASLVSAATLTWDANSGTTGNQDGAGTWNTTASTWNGSTGTLWNNATPDSAVFGAGSGTAGTVALGANITVDDLTFNATGGGNYTIAGGGFTLTFGTTAATIATSVPATITAPVAALTGNTLSKTGAATLTLAPTAASAFGQIINSSAGKIVLGGSSTNSVVAPTGAFGGGVRNVQQTGTWNGTTPLNGTVQVVGGVWNTGSIASNNTNASFRGTIQVTGGTLTFASGGRYIGSGNSEANLVVDGGVLRFTDGDRFSLGSDDINSGRGGGIVSVSAGTFEIYSNSAGNTLGSVASSRFDQTGGTVKIGVGTGASGTQRNLTIGGTNAGVFSAYTLAGGTLQVAGTLQQATANANGGRNNLNLRGGVLAAGAINATGLGYSTDPANPVANSTNVGALTNNGSTLAPGDIGTPGLTTITGDYTVNSGALAVDIAGLSPATGFQTSGAHDKVVVTGTATLGGTLAVTVAPNVYPLASDAFTILSATEITGAFTNVASGARLATTDGLGSFQVSIDDTSVELVNYIPATPPAAPTITAQPVTATVTQGASTTFSVTATGSNLRYQWQFNGVDIVGATSPALTVTGQPQSAGLYRVIVSNWSGGVTSNTATLVVNLQWSDPLAFRFDLDQAPAAGGAITDTTGRLSGTMTGSPVAAVVAGPKPYTAGAWNFTGAPGYIKANSNAVLQSIGDLSKTTGLTFSYWFNIDWTANGQIVAQLGNTFTIATGQTAGPHNPDFDVSLGGASAVTVNTPSSPYGSSGGTFLDGTWHHLVVTFDFTQTTDNIKCYVDGAQITPVYPWLPPTQQEFTASFNSPSSPFTLGANNSGGHPLSESNGNAKLDQFSVYTTALTPAEVAQLYNTATIANYAPRVLAGAEVTRILWPANTVNLRGSASDDGLPSNTLTTTWAKLSGPGNVAFGNAAALNTTATFSAPGTYVLTLKASDGSLSSTDRVTIDVAQNAAPVVYASIKGAPSTTVLTTAGTVALSGAAEDDGVSGSALTYQWTQVGGPATATFATPTAANSNVTLPSTPGAYVFRLTVSDGLLTSSTTVTVTVATNLPPTITIANAANPVLLWSATVSTALNSAATPAIAGHALAYQWSQVGGPGTANFAGATSANTSVTFTAPGTYQLRIAVTDAGLVSTYDVWVNAWARSPGFTPPSGKRVRSLQPTAPFVHPKLLFTDADRPEMLARAQNDPIAAAGYAAIITNINNTLYNPASPYGLAYAQMKAGNVAYNVMAVVDDEGRFPILGNTGSGYWGMLGTACYVAWLNQDTAKLAELAGVIANSARSQSLYGPTYRFCGNSLAFCYDVAFNSMTEDQRVATRALIVSITKGALMAAAGRADIAYESNATVNMNGAHFMWGYPAIQGEDAGFDAAVYAINMNNIFGFTKEWGISENGWGVEGYTYLADASMVTSGVAWCYRGTEDLFDTSRLLNSLLGIFYELQPKADGDPTKLYLVESHNDTGFENADFNLNVFSLKYLYPNDAFVDWIYRNVLKQKGANSAPLLRAMFGVSVLPGTPTWSGIATQYGIQQSILDPQRGLSVARSDWSTNALRVDFDARWNFGHNQGDGTNWTLYALGRDWVCDSGYGVSPSEVHSCVTIDGLGFAQSAYKTSNNQPARFMDWRDTGLYALSVGDNQFAYNYTSNSGTKINTTWTLQQMAYPGYVPPTPIQDPSNNGFFTSLLQVDADANGNPIYFNQVQRAYRSTLLVRGSKPYLIVVDDIQKDAAAHDYAWLANTAGTTDMQLRAGATATDAVIYHSADDPSGAAPAGVPQCLVRALQADGTATGPITLDRTPVPNGYGDSRTNAAVRITIGRNAVAPNYKVLLFPHLNGDALPTTTWNGNVLTVVLAGGQTDQITFTPGADGLTRVALVRTSAGAAPVAPSPPVATAGVKQATLSWTAVPGATGYNVKMAAVSGGPYVTLAANVFGTSQVVTGLAAGTPYYFVVSALNAAGESGNSAQTTATPTAAIAAPAAPATFGVTVNGNQATLTWSAVPGATGYNAYANVSGSGQQTPTSLANGVNVTSLTTGSLLPGVVYTFFVEGANAGGAGADSTKVNLVLTSPVPGASLQPPASVVATPGLRQITLTWAASAGATSYNLQRATTSGGPYTTVASNLAGTTFTDIQLTAGTTYYYVVSAVNASGESPDGNQINAAPLAATAAVGAPASVATIAGNAQAQITWSFVPGATGYNVKRGTVNGGPYGTTVSTNNAGLSYTNTGLANGTTYYYVVTATNSFGESLASAQASVTPSATTAIPPAPANLVATVAGASGQVSLAWNAAYGATGYRIYRSTTSGGYTATPLATTTGASYANTGLSDGTGYYYVVSATNAAGESLKSNEVLAFPVAPPPPPGTPAGLDAVLLSPASAQLTWGVAAGANPSTRYNLKRSTTSGGPYTTVSANNAGTSFINTGLGTGTTYYYAVTALNTNPATAESAPSPEVAVTTPSLAPANVTITPGPWQVTVSWTAAVGATSYDVYRSTSANGTYQRIGSGVTATSYTDLNSAGNQTYSYFVTAVNSGGASPISTIGTGTTQPIVPAAPAGLTAAPWNAQVDLHWNPVAYAASYKVKRATTSGGPYTDAGTTAATGYPDRALVNGTACYYVVSAVNVDGESANSAEITATPQAITDDDGWTASDIGSVGVAGTSDYGSSFYTIQGSGADIWGAADAFRYVYQPLTGDGCIIAQITGLTNTHTAAKAGVMIRETLAANSRHALVDLRPDNKVEFIRRATTGGSSTWQVTGTLATPYWVKLARAGNVFTAYASPDGVTWTMVGTPQTIAMGATAYAGLAVTSHLNTTLTTATIGNVSIVPGASWASDDIGAPATAGFTAYNNGVHTLGAATSGIGGTADQCRFTYVRANGDCDLVARVTGVQWTNNFALSGVMVRETLSAGAPTVMIGLMPNNGVAYLRRTTAGGTLTNSHVGGPLAPYWVRVTRVGDVFTTSYSADGATWTTYGSVTIPMAADTYLGLAASSNQTGAVGDATFDQLTVTP